ncbi:MAG: ribonuclease HII [Deltaproteobacteria bacterium]|nr:ribonuclease HII [Deltaproteobacteria bacterium]
MKHSQLWLSLARDHPEHSRAFEEEGFARGFVRIAGVDEVGRGPLAGPVVAAAVILPRDLTHSEIRDSKLLAAKKRESLALWIKQKAAAWGVGVVDSGEIDRVNIFRATFLAMARALRHLRPAPDLILIDGSYQIPFEFLKPEDKKAGDGRLVSSVSSSGPLDEIRDPKPETGSSRKFPMQRAIPKGDRLSLVIAAASILAKVERDRMMLEYDKLYPEYGFARHKGYGCLSHMQALRSHGPSPIHRMSFRPLREALARKQDNDPGPLFSRP